MIGLFKLAIALPSLVQSGSVLGMRSPVANDGGFDYAKAASKLRVKVEGSDEAKETLKRVSK